MILLEKFNSGQKVKQIAGYLAFIPNKINDTLRWENKNKILNAFYNEPILKVNLLKKLV